MKPSASSFVTCEGLSLGDHELHAVRQVLCLGIPARRAECMRVSRHHPLDRVSSASLRRSPRISMPLSSGFSPATASARHLVHVDEVLAQGANIDLRPVGRRVHLRAGGRLPGSRRTHLARAGPTADQREAASCRCIIPCFPCMPPPFIMGQPSIPAASDPEHRVTRRLMPLMSGHFGESVCGRCQDHRPGETSLPRPRKHDRPLSKSPVSRQLDWGMMPAYDLDQAGGATDPRATAPVA